MATIPTAFQALMRKAYQPIVSPGDGPLAGSKFSGRPFLNQGEQWPVCPNCGQRMQLFVQLDLDTLPEPLRGEFGSGILQMFYCTNKNPLCEMDCGAWAPFSKSQLVRIVQPQERIEIAAAYDDTFFPPKQIVGWQPLDDYPNWEEGEELGVMLSDEEQEALGELGFPLSGDKLVGWPDWVQVIEYPDCPICGEKMRLVFQIDSEDNLPHMFGDVGCGHITQCKTHKEQLAFGWACA
jgi:hypothetical protein